MSKHADAVERALVLVSENQGDPRTGLNALYSDALAAEVRRLRRTVDRLRREKVAFINGDVGRCTESKYFGQWFAMNADRPFATAQAALNHLCGPEYAHDCPVCRQACVCAEVPDVALERDWLSSVESRTGRVFSSRHADDCHAVIAMAVAISVLEEAFEPDVSPTPPPETP